VFFFQAEDGIRDRNVTGVQTCALPIWLRLPETWSPLGRSCVPRSGALEAVGQALVVTATTAGRCWLAPAQLARSPMQHSLARRRSEERRVGKERRSRDSLSASQRRVMA